MSKYYAVRKGINPGIYRSWSECKEQVIGVSGADYKSFHTKSEAIKFMNTLEKEPDIGDVTGLIATVEHYRDTDSPTHGYRIKYEEDSELVGFDRLMLGTPEEPISSIKAELEGVLQSLRWAINEGYSKVTIQYQYKGIKHFAKGEWKPKKEHTVKYTQEFNKLKQNITVDFVAYKEFVY